MTGLSAGRRIKRDSRIRMETRSPRSNHWLRRARGPYLECLENRSMLSTLPLSGFPTHGFRTDRLGDDAPWEIATIIDQEATQAVAFAEGSDLIDDAPRVALEIGEPTWLAGVIGDTPIRGAAAATNDVDFYRFDLPGDDHYAVRLEVAAQRFGSELDAAVSVFAANGTLIASNDDALHEGFLSDAELFCGLDSGSYFVAVSAGGNVPGQDGGFDPSRPGSGTGSRGSRGQYLLGIEAVPDTTRPRVASVNIEDGATLDMPPTWITVRFTEPMNLQRLESGATLTGADGEQLDLAHVRYDSLTDEITYLVLDRAPAGDYEFTLHAAEVVDRANNALAGEDGARDFTVSFHVAADAPSLEEVEENDSSETSQSLGALFENELRRGIRIKGTIPAHGGAETITDEDYYRIEVLRDVTLLRLQLQFENSVPPGASVSLRNAAGNLIVRSSAAPGFGAIIFHLAAAGEYSVQVSAPVGAADATYRLTISAPAFPEIVLTDNGPVVSVQVALRSNDGLAPTVQTESSPANLIIVDGNIVAAVSALSPVATSPAGRPRIPPAESGELAWLDNSPSGNALPDGFSVRRPQGQSASASVNRVSGSFLDALPDQLDGTHALGASAGVIGEIAELVRGGYGSSSARRSESSYAARNTLADEALELAHNSESTQDAEPIAISPKTLTFGMAVALGVASAATVPSRRRSTNWFQRAIEALGLESN